MDKAKLITRLMNTFLDELQEHVRVLNRESLALEKNPAEAERARRLQELLRTAHSLKGAARSVDISLIEDACHGLEDLLAGVRDNRVAFDSELFSLLFATADSLEEAGCACGSSGTSPTRRSARCCHGSRPPREFLHSGPSSRRRALLTQAFRLPVGMQARCRRHNGRLPKRPANCRRSA
ncbi:MAG: Hpt domain-containing protein [Planctomycetaceae bacterium]|nr:Hpt domain-containing protein [Planctomycetaceae bacterium]